jgi:hypothetical protein
MTWQKYLNMYHSVTYWNYSQVFLRIVDINDVTHLETFTQQGWVGIHQLPSSSTSAKECQDYATFLDNLAQQ